MASSTLSAMRSRRGPTSERRGDDDYAETVGGSFTLGAVDALAGFVPGSARADRGPEEKAEEEILMSVKHLDLNVFRDDGYLQEVNRAFFHPLGLALEVDLENQILRVWDYREDPDGIRFVDVDLTPNALKFSQIREARRAQREKALGYW